jgi:hypothetical protein
MSKIRLTFQTFALLAFMLALTSLAQAQATRTWVSGVGDDVNPCSRTAPCKTWAGAISKTAAGGEIDALDPGGFGTLTITKSITVDGTNGQGFGSTLFSGASSGFTINDSATGAPGTIKVILRNLSINGTGTTLGVDGIRFISGASLKVENTRIMTCSGDGIEINQVAAGKVDIVNTVISNCGFGVRQIAGSVLTQIHNSNIVDNTSTGVQNEAGLININNSVISGNGASGVAGTTSSARTHVLNNVITNNATNGVRAEVGAVVTVSGNDIFRNGTGLSNAGTMETYRNNRLRNNTTQTSGVLTDVSALSTGVF